MVWAWAVGAAWSAARGWLTPAVLFVAVNLVIATIAVASRLVSPGPGDGDEAVAAGEWRGQRGFLLRAPSLAVDRLRSSLSFSRLGLAGDHYAQPLLVSDDDAGAPEPDPALQPPAAEAPVAQAERGREEAEAEAAATRIERSRSEAAAEAPAAASTRRRARALAPRATVEVDARADDFIRRFREQLRLQRLDSILRYRDTLRRTGTA